MNAWERIAEHLDLVERVAWRRFVGLTGGRSDQARRELARSNVDWGDVFHDALIRLARYADGVEFESDLHFRRWVVIRTRFVVVDVVRRILGDPGSLRERMRHRQELTSKVPAPEVDIDAQLDAETFWERVRVALGPGEYRVVRTWAEHTVPVVRSRSRTSRRAFVAQRGVDLHRLARVARSSFWPMWTSAKARLWRALA